ncbi:helix-turn-helix transcriptional regulator [Actinoallomurus liliacearum]|uniref:helix-turn-helix domain-containing protein n=1 Tax=Actinoallomurus liliacearum TaxID=1080073 RepID=UPI0031E955A7
MSPNAGPAARFALELRALREQAGNLPYWKMARRCQASKSALAEAAAGRQIPSERVLDAYVSVCGGDLNKWRARRVEALEELEAAARPGTALLPAGDRSPVGEPGDASDSADGEETSLPALRRPASVAAPAGAGSVAAADIIDADVVEDSILSRVRASIAGHAAVYLAGLALLVAVGTSAAVLLTRPASKTAIVRPGVSSPAPARLAAAGGGAPASASPSASPDPSASGSPVLPPVLPPVTAPTDPASASPSAPRTGRTDSGRTRPTTGRADGTSHPYKVTGADSDGLAVQTEPHVNHVLHYVPNGTTLHVVCQTNHGDWVKEDDRWQYGRHFTTWDRLADGTWVYDWYMTTPRVDASGYSPGISPCPGG